MSRPTKAFQQERTELAAINQRRCIRCYEVKALDQEFPLDATCANGFAGECTACRRNRHRGIHHGLDGLDGANHNGYNRAARAGRPRRRFKTETLIRYWQDHGIDPWRCYYTGVKLTREPGLPNTRNLDHIEPLVLKGSKGHVLANIVPCSRVFNLHKNSDRAVIAVLTAPGEVRNPPGLAAA